MQSDPIRGKTIRWTFQDGPTAGKTFEHTFAEDGSVTYTMAGGSGKGTREKEYKVARINDDVVAVSYLASSGYTLTTILDFKARTATAFASNEKGLFEQHGTFELVGARAA